MSEPNSSNPGHRGRWCEECGYDLRGLPPGQPCPECGHLTREDESRASPYTAWARRVFCGLALLVLVTLDAASAVLIQPTGGALGGIGPALNVPGPKLWAMPLLQRPIGQRPELPGVMGTRSAFLSLLAVWLLTAPGAAARLQPDQLLRRLTRWGSVALFGAAFGVMLAAERLWPQELPPYRLLLAAGVELPATVLLYAYLYRLAGHVPGQGRRVTLGRLAKLVPLAIAGGAAALALHWVRPSAAGGGAGAEIPHAFLLLGSAAYGVLATGCGVAATAAVASLAAAYFHLGFPRARRWAGGGLSLWRRARVWPAQFTPARGRDLRVAGGLLLLVVTANAASEQVFWMTARLAPGGNLPFINYPGPKVWVTAVTVGLGDHGRYFSWGRIGSQSFVVFLNVGAVWLLTSPVGPGGRGKLRLAARATTVLSIGAAAGCTLAWSADYPLYELLEHRLAYLTFAVVTVVLEWPATAILYLFLARLARNRGRPLLARQFHLVNVGILFIMAGAMLMFGLSRTVSANRESMPVLAIAVVYGMGTLATAAWATATVLALAGAILRDAWAGNETAPLGGGAAGSNSD